jgi:hypothetical protein
LIGNVLAEAAIPKGAGRQSRAVARARFREQNSRVWITDRGMASAANLAWLRDTGRRYIIGAPKSELKKFGAELARADDWRTVHEGVEVKLARHPETDETVILCRSADRLG